MSRDTPKLRIPSSTLKLADVRRFVEEHARKFGFSADVVDQLSLAVDEACTNVIRHAYRGKKEGPVDILIDFDNERFTVTIRDEGYSMDEQDYKYPNLERSIKKRRAGGFGVHIMRRLMDQVEYEQHEEFNEVHLTKYRQNDPSAVRH